MCRDIPTDPSRPCRSSSDGHAQKNGINDSSGLAAHSTPRSGSIPEGSMSSGAQLAAPPALGQTGKAVGRNSQPGGSPGRAAHAGSEPHSQDLGKHSRAGVVCSFAWIIPGSFPGTPGSPGSNSKWLQLQQELFEHLQCPLPSLAVLSQPKPSMPMISA